MPSSLLVAGLDARSLLLEAPVLQRDRHLVQERNNARDLLREIVPTGARLVVLGTELPDLTLPDAVRRIRASAATREVSVMAILPAIMFLCYLTLIVYFKSKGGYQIQHLAMSGEQAAGGIEAPVR